MTPRRFPVAPQLLPLAAAPVLLAGGAAAQLGAFAWPKALLALLVTVALLVGVCYADSRGSAAWLWPLAVAAGFGPAATLGTLYVLSGQISWQAVAGAVGVGALAGATWVVAHLRDLAADDGRRGIAVLFGENRTRWLYAGLVAVPFLAAIGVAVAEPWALLAVVAVVVAVAPTRTVLSGRMGRGLTPVWRDTAAITLYYAALLGIGLFLSR